MVIARYNCSMNSKRTTWCEKVIGDNDILLCARMVNSSLNPHGPPATNNNFLVDWFILSSMKRAN